MLDLDSLAGEPVITRALAERLGFDLVRTGGEIETASMVKHLSGIARESGDAMSRLAEALADGRLTPHELTEIERDLGDLDAQVQGARATCRALLMKARGEA